MIDNENIKKTSESFKRLRQSVGLNQNQMSKECGIGQPVLNRIENGETFPSIVTLMLMSKYFNVSIDELIFNEVKNYFLNEDDNTFMAKFRFIKGLDDDAQELICRTAKRFIK